MPLMTKETSKGFPVWTLYGPPGAGKTIAAMTISPKCVLRPVEQRSTEILLDDLAYIMLDRDGIRSAASFGLDTYVWDFSNFPANMAMWQSAVESKIPEIKAHVQKMGTRCLILDAISTMTSAMEIFKLSDERIKDPRMAHAAAQQMVKDILTQFKTIPCFQVWLIHSRNMYKADEASTAAQRKELDIANAKRRALLPGEYDTSPDLSPGMAKIVTGLVSATFAVDHTIDKEGNEERAIVTKAGVYYCKNRFDGIFAPREKVDLNGMLNKIAAFDSSLKTAEK